MARSEGVHSDDVVEPITIHIADDAFVTERHRQLAGGHHRGRAVVEVARIGRAKIDQEFSVVIVTGIFTGTGVALGNTVNHVVGIAIHVQVDTDVTTGFWRVVVDKVDVGVAVVGDVSDRNGAGSWVGGTTVLGKQDWDSIVIEAESLPIAVGVVAEVVVDARLSEAGVQVVAHRGGSHEIGPTVIVDV